jgi:SET domain-containing protein 6
MKAIKPIRAGEEIFNDYGEIPRADLLRRYGYVTDNYAPYDVIELSLDLLCAAAGLGDSDIENQPRVIGNFTTTHVLHIGLTPSQLQLLENLELLDDGYDIPRPSDDDAATDIIPEELAVLLRTLTLTPEQFAHQQEKQKPPKPTFGQEEARLLRAAIVMGQGRYSTTIEQDRELLAQLYHLEASGPLGGSSRRRKMATQVRIGEKEIFELVKLKIDTYLGNAEGGTTKRAANEDGDDSRRTKAQRT